MRNGRMRQLRRGDFSAAFLCTAAFLFRFCVKGDFPNPEM
jgi:hypothetical protein